MAEIIQYWDESQDKYIEVSTTTPLPTNAIGGGSGGAEEVEITSANGAATTGAADSDNISGSAIGLVTTARLYGADGTDWDRLHAQDGANDQISSATKGLLTTNRNYLYNGVSWDKERNNVGATLFASAVHTGTHSSPTQTNFNHSGLILFINITANPGGAETVSLNFHYVDPVSGLVTPTAATFTVQPAVNGTYSLILYPGSTTVESPSQNKTYGLPVPREWQASVAHSGAGSWTYSVGYSYII